MHVTSLSVATIHVFAIVSPSRAQGIEVFGGYSVNADYVQNRPAIPVVDQKVSPFFSLGSGPTGFEASFKHDVRPIRREWQRPGAPPSRLRGRRSPQSHSGCTCRREGRWPAPSRQSSRRRPER